MNLVVGQITTSLLKSDVFSNSLCCQAMRVPGIGGHRPSLLQLARLPVIPSSHLQA